MLSSVLVNISTEKFMEVSENIIFLKDVEKTLKSNCLTRNYKKKNTS